MGELVAGTPGTESTIKNGAGRGRLTGPPEVAKHWALALGPGCHASPGRLAAVLPVPGCLTVVTRCQCGLGAVMPGPDTAKRREDLVVRRQGIGKHPMDEWQTLPDHGRSIDS
jgi:hypothetical protein